MSAKKKIGILGASGYTGADAVRLLARHPHAEITALTANTHAGKTMDEVFPHLFMLDLPRLKEWAYAGVLINMTGAAASYVATRQSATNLIPPAVVAGVALLSWALRPPTRRL